MKSKSGVPLPPLDLATKTLPLDIVPAGTILHRFHQAQHSPIYYDKTDSGRFNAPDSSFGTLYAAVAQDGAFAEVFLRNVGATLVSQADVLLRGSSTVQLTRDTAVVRLLGTGLHTLGTTSAVSSVWPYTAPQAWAKALFGHPSAPDGISYRSRHDDDQQCIAFFERSPPYLVTVATTTDLLSQHWFLKLLDKYGVGLDI